MRNSKAHSQPRLKKKSDILTPLVMLFRGNKEIKKKKRRFLRNTKSQREIKQTFQHNTDLQLDSVLPDSPSGFNISVNPATKKLEYEDTITNSSKKYIIPSKKGRPSKSRFFNRNLYKSGKKTFKSHIHTPVTKSHPSVQTLGQK